MKYLFSSIFILCCFVSKSQTKTDSLLKILNETNDHLIIAETCLDLADEYNKLGKDKTIQYIEKGIKSAIRVNNNSLIGDLYYMKAQLYDYYEEWDSSMSIYYQSAKYYQLLNDSANIALCYSNTGLTHYFNGNYIQAEKDYQISLINFLGSTDLENTAKLYNNFALLYKAKGNYIEAINKYLESLSIKEKINDETGIANTYQNIGVLFWEQKNYDEALSNYNNAVDLFKKLDDFEGLGSIYLNMSLIYKEKNDTALALKYNNEAIEILKKTDYSLGLSSALTNKGIMLNESGDIIASEKHFLESLKLCEEINYNTGILVNKVSLSRIYSLQGKYKLSQDYASEAVEIAEKSNSLKYLSEAYMIISKNYADIKQYKFAYNFLNRYNSVKDSLYSIETNKQINEIKTKFETEKKEVKINLLEKESEIQNLELDKKSKRLRTISIILTLTFCFLIITSILFLQKRKAYLSLVEQNIKLAQKDIEKEKQFVGQNLNMTKNDAQYKHYDSPLDIKHKKELIEDIVILMEEEKFFLNSGFTVNEFAKKLKTNRNYVSLIINEHFNTNFNNFVNEYRIKEARKLLISKEYMKYSIAGIASTVGFNSKATFNSAFKKFTGVTPSFFQKNSRNY